MNKLIHKAVRSLFPLLCLFMLLNCLSVQVYAQYCSPTYIPTGTWAGFDGCGSSGTFPLGHLITNVTIGTINNTVTTANCTNYDFTAQSTVVYDDGPCLPTPMTVTVNGYCGVTVAVDLNNDNDFDDPGEIVIPNSYVASSPATYNLQLPIPPGTSVGMHRMRVYNAGANSANASGGACGTFDFGNFHDYTIDVEHNPDPPTAQTIVDTAICHGQSLVYNGTTYTTSQQILDTLQTVTGCDSFLTINLTVLPLAINNMQQTICNGETINFGGQVCAASGIYHDTLQTALGCDSLVNLSLTVLPPPVVQNENEQICQGDSFSFAGKQLTASGLYYDSLYYTNGCDSFITALNLTVYPSPVITATYQGSQAQLCIGDTVILTGQGALSYQWYDSTRHLISGQSPFTYRVPREVNYIYVIGTDGNSCTGRDTVIINADACCWMELPTAFSPNGDGTNDNFKPSYIGNPQNYYLGIYDRWGHLVFKSFNPDLGWNGLYGNDGKPSDIGTYYYRMTSTCANGVKLERKGAVTLIK
jgi:gliding motility-associated-like protein